MPKGIPKPLDDSVKRTYDENNNITREEAFKDGEKVKDTKVELTQDQFQTLMNRLNKLEDSRTEIRTEAPQSIDATGRPIGIMVKYSVDPAHYKDPRESLYDMPKLRKYALKDNYMIDYELEQQVVDTKYGTTYLHPKFILKLWKKMFDDEDNPTDKRFLIQTGIFFEDPETSIKEALSLGLPVEEANESDFLEKMRFYRYEQWLLDIFNPKRLTSTKPKVRDEVIAGKVYQVEEYSNVV